MEIEMSALPKTWILDLDGTVVKHNGYKIDGRDSLLPGVRDFLNQVEKEDMVIFVTSRGEELREDTENFLNENQIRYDRIIYGAPYGERILINDSKPSGLCMAYAFDTKRDEICEMNVLRNDSL